MPEQSLENVLDRLEKLHDYYENKHDELMESFYNSEYETQKTMLLLHRNYFAECLYALEIAMDIIVGVED